MDWFLCDNGLRHERVNDIAPVSSLFLRSDSRILASKSTIQQRQLSKLVRSSVLVQYSSKAT